MRWEGLNIPSLWCTHMLKGYGNRFQSNFGAVTCSRKGDFIKQCRWHLTNSRVSRTHDITPCSTLVQRSPKTKTIISPPRYCSTGRVVKGVIPETQSKTINQNDDDVRVKCEAHERRLRTVIEAHERRLCSTPSQTGSHYLQLMEYRQWRLQPLNLTR
jgi:hypothetical protein